jgi:hypothetical protein
MNPQYQIRIQVVLAADDDGANGATVTAAQIKARLDVANGVFASANVSFVFDEATDLLQVDSTLLNREFTILDPPDVDGDKWSQEPTADSKSHDDARTRLARLFPGKLVIFFRKRNKFEQENGVWKLVGAGGSSGWGGFLVNMPASGGDGNLLAHELGHYLQIRHSHRGGIKTVAEAAQAIKKYVEDNDKPVGEGLDALDSDRVWVRDTPADVSSSIFTNQGLDPCGPTEHIPIPVTFSNNTSRVYTLAPDRSNVMSYFTNCPGVPLTISPQQARRVRDGLEMGLRHSLISLKPRHDYTLVRGGSGAGGGVDRLDVALVRAGRVATAVRNSDGNLKVIVWDVSADGMQVTRRGDKLAGAISDVALCGLGLDMLATAVITGGELKVIIWQVDENGQVTRKESGVVAAGKVNDVAVCRVGIEHLATAVRREDGTLRVDAWHVTARGEITHKGSEAAGQINTPGAGAASKAPRLAMNSVGTRGFATYLRDSNLDLKAILWQYDDGKVTRLGSAGPDGDQVVALAGCALERETAVAAARGMDGKLNLFAYHFPDDGARVERRGTAQAGSITEVAACRVGTELCVTGVRLPNNQLKLILWHVSKDGHHIMRRDDALDEAFTSLAMCHAGANLFVAATRGAGGNLNVVAWRLQAPVAAELGAHAFRHVFARAPDPTAFASDTPNGARPGAETLCDSERDGSNG